MEDSCSGSAERPFLPLSPSVRFSVYLKTQDHLKEAARHETSREVACLVVAALYGRPIGQNAIQLTVKEPWETVKGWILPARVNRRVPALKPPRRPENLLLYYPIRDQRTRGMYSCG